MASISQHQLFVEKRSAYDLMDTMGQKGQKMIKVMIKFIKNYDEYV
jgi:hypothetical protein